MPEIYSDVDVESVGISKNKCCDKPTDHPTDKLSDKTGHREVTLPLIWAYIEVIKRTNHIRLQLFITTLKSELLISTITQGKL